MLTENVKSNIPRLKLQHALNTICVSSISPTRLTTDNSSCFLPKPASLSPYHLSSSSSLASLSDGVSAFTSSYTLSASLASVPRIRKGGMRISSTALEYCTSSSGWLPYCDSKQRQQSRSQGERSRGDTYGHVCKMRLLP